MKLFISILAAACLATAMPTIVDVQYQHASPLHVTLEKPQGTAIKAIITNTADEHLNILKTGSILDDTPVQKIHITSQNKPIEFNGLYLHIATDSLTPSDFQIIPAGESASISFDITETHNISPGGVFTIRSEGAFAYAHTGSTQILGLIPFQSNTITTTIYHYPSDTATLRKPIHQKRFRLRESCTGTRLNITNAALSNCASTALKAQTAALSGPASRLNDFFKSSSNQTRSIVSSVFGRIADECGASSSSISSSNNTASFFCSDVFHSCTNSTVGYAAPGVNVVAFCDKYFDELPAKTQTCHALDQVSAVIHETTHLMHVKKSLDYGGYGYEFVKGLPAELNVNHADTYALFANAVGLGC